jgi:hypothetical protein
MQIVTQEEKKKEMEKRLKQENLDSSSMSESEKAKVLKHHQQQISSLDREMAAEKARQQEILKEKNPAAAEFIRIWTDKYQKNYDFSSPEEQALFYEGMLEMARFVAKNSQFASVRSTPCSSGLSEVIVGIVPNA